MAFQCSKSMLSENDNQQREHGYNLSKGNYGKLKETMSIWG